MKTLVFTTLTKQAMPIIRYRTGDIVTLSDESCPCGRTLSSIKISGGRIADFIVTNNGVWIPGYAFIYICRSVKGITKFQVVQKRRGELKVYLAVDDRFPPDGKEQIVKAVRQRIDSDDEILVEVVDDIEPAQGAVVRDQQLGDQEQGQAAHAGGRSLGAGEDVTPPFSCFCFFAGS